MLDILSISLHESQHSSHSRLSPFQTIQTLTHVILRVSGHKSESRIRSYSRRLPESKQIEISVGCSTDHAVLPVLNLPTNNEDLELTSSQFQHAVGSLSYSPLHNINSLPGSPSLLQNIFAQQTTLKNNGVRFASGHSYNCQVTVNFI